MSDLTDRVDAVSRRRARLMPVFALLLLTQQSLFWTADDRAVTLVRSFGWTVMVVAMLAALVTGGGLLLPREVRALANDKVTQAHRATSIQHGFVAAIATAILVFVMAPFEPISAQRAVHMVVSIGLAVAMLSFGLLERKSLD